jgi:hypothetical protein
LVFRDASYTELASNEVVLVDNTAKLGTWTQHTVTADAPTGTVSVEAYILFVSPSLYGGAAWVDDANLRTYTPAAVSSAPRANAFELRPVAPNPFRQSARIDYTLPQRGDVTLGVYDVTGRHIATVFHGSLEAGPHVATWDGRTSDGIAAAPGIYKCILQTAAGRQSRSMVLSR